MTGQTTSNGASGSNKHETTVGITGYGAVVESGGDSHKGMVSMERQHGNSWWETLSTIFKGVVGSGILALPVAFKETGLALGTICLLIFAVISLYTHRIIILTIQALRKKQLGGPDGRIEYQDLSRYTFGWLGEAISAFSMITTQLGGCVSFLVFIAENMRDVTGVSVVNVMFCLFPVLTLMALIKDGSLFAGTSHLGNLALILAISTVFWYGFSHSPPSSDLSKYTHFRPHGLPIFFGIGVYTFSAHCEVVFIEQSMKKRSEFLSVLTSAFVAITALYLAFGALCYMFFGDQTSEIIFENLGTSNFVLFVKVCICVALLVQYPLVLLPATTTIEDLLKAKESMVWSNIVRILLVAFTVFLAIAIPSFEVVTSFVGAFSNGVVAFVLPPLCYLAHAPNLGSLEKCFNYGLAVFGVVASVYSSIVVLACVFQPNASVC